MVAIKKLPFKSKKYSDSFYPNFSQLWSLLPKTLREQRVIILFKTQLKCIFKLKQNKKNIIVLRISSQTLCFVDFVLVEAFSKVMDLRYIYRQLTNVYAEILTQSQIISLVAFYSKRKTGSHR